MFKFTTLGYILILYFNKMLGIRLLGAFSMVLGLTIALTCGGNCPQGNCSECFCGTTQNVVSTASLCTQYSGWSPSCCNCIANKESHGNTNAQRKDAQGVDFVGLWQINSTNWSQCNGGEAPCDASSNLACAIKVH